MEPQFTSVRPAAVERQVRVAWDGSRPRRDEDHDAMSDAIEPVMRVTGFSEDDLRGQKRSHAVSLARQLAMWRLRNEGYSMKAIGRFFGGRDHSTVLYSVRRADDRMRGLV